MHRRNTEIFKNPIHLVRPLTVDQNRRLERRKNYDIKTNERRPKTGGLESTNTYNSDFQSSSTSTNFSFASDEDYDTDLDDDVNQYRDRSCIGMYKYVCKYEQIVPVGQYLKHYDQKELLMHYYGLGSKGMRAFLPSLTMNTYITKLDLTSNGLGDKGIIYLSQILRDNIAIVDINLSQNFIGLDGTRHLCDMFKDNVTINHLKLEGNLLNDECARLLAELISSTGQLYTLNLAKNKLGSTSGIFLGQAIAENTTMESLDLSWNSINGKGAVALIKGIQENVFLKKLNLAHNGLSGAECGRAWFNAFKENTSLVELDISHNRLTTEPATYIGRGLAKSESLQIIRLTGNPLESAGCYAILKPLIGKDTTPNKLELIDLTEILLNNDCQELYLQVKTQRPEIRVLAGLRTLPPLLKSSHRSQPSPMERLHTLFQRRPELDLANFFYSIAASDDQMSDDRITDHSQLKQAIQETLNAQFSDADIDKILKEIAQFDCKKFIQTFDNKPTTTSLSSSSCRFKKIQGAMNNNCELECTREEADFIGSHLLDFVTSEHRSIWFTYQTKLTDQSSENNKFIYSKNPIQKSWKVLYNLGSMISYDKFIDHILNNRHPARIKINKDTRGRVRSIILEIQYTQYRIIFDLNILHTNILVKYGQEKNNEPIQIILMLKGLPQIEQQHPNGDFIRICNLSEHNIDLAVICQCSDLWLQFGSLSDAQNFLQQLLTFSVTKKFVQNYVDFQFSLSSNDKTSCLSLYDKNFSSILGSYGMKMLESLGYLFKDKYLIDHNIQSRFILCHEKSSDKFYELCHVLWKNLQQDHCYLLRNIFDDQNIFNCTLSKNKYQVPHAIVTPLRILFQPIHLTTGHRAMRQYDKKKGYEWMLVYIRDEDSFSKMINMKESDELRSRYGKVLLNGLCLESFVYKELMYYYFGSSGSQMKEQEFWFLASTKVNSADGASTVNKARIALGDLKKIQNIATYIARVGLYLTTSKPTDIKLTFVGKNYWGYPKVSLSSPFTIAFQRWIKPSADHTTYKAYLIDDIERHGYCFTDGNGLISLGLAKKVAISIGIRINKNKDIPSAYQVRVAGCKGMLSIDPQSTMNDNYIKVRKSMMKFASDDWTLDIVDHSRLSNLNNQIIRLLYDLNKENKAVIESLQNRCCLQNEWHPSEEAYLNIFDSKDIDRIKDDNRRCGYLNAKDLLRCNKIPLPVDESRCLFGIADETKSLKEGQCFIQYQTMDKNFYKVVKGEVLVTKNPCLYPGDILCLEAVDIPALRPFIRDCIVFPVLGRRPHSNEIAGSDLDVTPELVVTHILDKLDDTTYGNISNTHSVIADKHPDGTMSAECKFLAELFPRAIDSIKTGEQINMEEMKELREKWCDTYPTWMMKDDKPNYKSTTINEHLFTRAQNLRINGSAYKCMHIKYDKINKDTLINIEEDDDTVNRDISIYSRNDYNQNEQYCINRKIFYITTMIGFFIVIYIFYLMKK
ncbi:unnamed protein product [Rotaria sp. Silwood1]|nr:unnamed protein product [Rotaria sp. Silwood1]